MEESRVMPKSIDYSSVLPMSVPAVAKRRRFFPNNGPVFANDGTSEIRIDIHSPNALLDAQHSYLEFEFENQGLPGGAITFGLDIGGGNVFFDSVRVEQGGRVISETLEYNRLNAAVLAPLQDSFGARTTQSITEGQLALQGGGGNSIVPSNQAAARGENQSATRHNSATASPAKLRRKITCPIISGLFTQDKMIPLPLLKEPITLVLRLTQTANLGAFSASPVAAGSVRIVKANYVAQLVEVGGDVINQFRMMRDMMGGQLAISGQDWVHTSGVIPAGSTGEQVVRVPTRKKSIKSLFWVANSSTFGTGSANNNIDEMYNLSFGGSCNCSEYQLKVGSVVYPPTPIQCFGNTAGATCENERGECAQELAKAIGSLAITNNSGHGIAAITYGAVGNTTAAAARVAAGGNVGLSNGDNGDGAGADFCPLSAQPCSVCPFGIDLDAFQATAIEAGVDNETMAEEMNLIITVANGANSGLEDKTIHTWCCYDKHYYFNADGSLTFSD